MKKNGQRLKSVLLPVPPLSDLSRLIGRDVRCVKEPECTGGVETTDDTQFSGDNGLLTAVVSTDVCFVQTRA